MPAAAWVAAVGVALVLTAAAVLVVPAWNHIGSGVKLAGLVALNGLVAAAAAWARRSFPVVARSLAHLAATLVVPSGVAVMATAHQHWPAAIAVGGACGVVACVLQSRRWSASWLLPAAELAGALSLAGIATGTMVPLGVALVAAAAALLVAGWNRGAARLAILAAAVPTLSALGALGVGPGTAVRLGARGDVLIWAGPVAGLIAAAVLVVVARRQRTMGLVPPAASALLSGLVAGLAQGHAPFSLWAGLPAFAVLLTLAVGDWLAAQADTTDTTDSPRSLATVARVTTSAAHGALTGVGALLVAVPFAIAHHAHRDVTLAGTMALWAVAFLAAGLRRPRVSPIATDAASASGPASRPPWWTPLAALERAAAGLAIVAAAAAATGGHLTAPIAGVALTIGLVVAARSHVGRTMAKSAWQVLLTERIALAAITLVAAAHRGDRVSLVVGVAGAALALVVGDRHNPVERQLVVAAVALAATVLVAWGWPVAAWAMAMGFAGAVVVLLAGRCVHGAAAVLVPFAATVLVAGHAGSPATALTLLLAAAAVTGMAMVFERWTPLDTLAVALGIGAALMAVDAGLDNYLSLAIALIGAQSFLYGTVRRERRLQAAGAMGFAIGALSLPWTSGFVPWLVHGLAPHGVTGTDLGVAVLVVGLLAGGIRLRQVNRSLSSWIAYGPGLALAGLHLLSTQVPAHQNGRIAVTIGLGVCAVAVGGLRRLAAPLLVGTGLLVAATVLAAGHQLASLPVWVWLAVGGLVLLALALLIEKRSPAGDDDRELDAGRDGERLVQVVWRRFS